MLCFTRDLGVQYLRSSIPNHDIPAPFFGGGGVNLKRMKVSIGMLGTLSRAAPRRPFRAECKQSQPYWTNIVLSTQVLIPHLDVWLDALSGYILDRRTCLRNLIRYALCSFQFLSAQPIWRCTIVNSSWTSIFATPSASVIEFHEHWYCFQSLYKMYLTTI